MAVLDFSAKIVYNINMRNKMILENLGLIYKAMKNLHCEYKDKDDYDEIYNAGLFGLINGVDTYDNERDLGYYLYVCIANEIKRLFQTRTLKKNYNGLQEVSLNEIMYDEETELQETIPSDENIEEDILQEGKIERIYNILKQLEDKLNLKMLYQYYGIGYKQKNQKELAEEYNITRQAIQQKIIKQKEKLRNELLKKYKDELEDLF